jgi:C4-type Zn-finger protein
MTETTGEREESWDYCDRCGFRRKEVDLVIQRGLKVCKQTCEDEPDYHENAQGLQR